MFTEKDTSNLLTDFDRRTQANGNMHCGMYITKNMKALLHCVQYFYRISEDPTIDYLNEVIFIQKWDTAIYKSEI